MPTFLSSKTVIASVLALLGALVAWVTGSPRLAEDLLCGCLGIVSGSLISRFSKPSGPLVLLVVTALSLCLGSCRSYRRYEKPIEVQTGLINPGGALLNYDAKKRIKGKTFYYFQNHVVCLVDKSRLSTCKGCENHATHVHQ